MPASLLRCCESYWRGIDCARRNIRRRGYASSLGLPGGFALPRVLIVDDEPGIRFALKRWFERQTWIVEEAEDGQQALRLVERDDAVLAFDLIVSDLHLPGISGEELLLKLQGTQPALAARLILTTGDSVQDAAPDSVLATHPHVLQKPFDLSTLRAAVERVMA